MKKILGILFLIVLPTSLWAADSVKVPWQEIKRLYQESIEQKYKEKTEKKKVPFKYNIGAADYQITIDKSKAFGDLVVSGKVVAGEPESFSLFDKELVISNVNQVSGGNLVRDKEHEIFFWPNKEKTFHINLSFLLPVQEDSRSRYIRFSPPRALKNTLALKIPPGFRLLDQPGIKSDTGTYHFGFKDSVKIRFSDKKALTASKVVEIDALSRIRIQGRQAIVTAVFYPVQSISEPFSLDLPDEALYISSSLKKSWITKSARNTFQIKLPTGLKETFNLVFAYNETASPGRFSVSLPVIKDNNGNQGIFTLEQPEDGHINLTGETLAVQIPAAALNKRLFQAHKDNPRFLKIAPAEKISLQIRKYQAVRTPSIVLDSVSFYSSFEENGSILNLLIMDVPPETGMRLSLKSIPEAEIWHLKVNQRKAKIYGDQGNSPDSQQRDRWIVPLEKGKASHVELAYIQKGQKIGLQGRLETIVPEIGLPSQNILVGIGLPERVQLLSLEGPVSPVMAHPKSVPAEFVGRPYYFSRSFYNGDEMRLAVSYKEPVNVK